MSKFDDLEKIKTQATKEEETILEDEIHKLHERIIPIITLLNTYKKNKNIEEWRNPATQKQMKGYLKNLLRVIVSIGKIGMFRKDCKALGDRLIQLEKFTDAKPQEFSVQFTYFISALEQLAHALQAAEDDLEKIQKYRQRLAA